VRGRRGTVAALAVWIIVAAVPAHAQDAAARGARWLVDRQQPDGVFFAAGQKAHETADVLVALAAARAGGDAVARGARAILRTRPEEIERAGNAARVVMGLSAAGSDLHGYAARLVSFYDPATGRYDAGVYADALALLGVVAAGRPVPERALTYLRAHQCAGGGFAHAEGCAGTPDVDTTAMVVSAFLAGGVPADDLAIERARSFLTSVQNPDGGFGLEAGKPTNANSTGLVLSALAALHEDPAGKVWTQPDGHGPLGALAALQTASGGFRYVAPDTEPNGYATVQAIPGLSGAAYPVAPAAISPDASRDAAPLAGNGPASDRGPLSTVPRNPGMQSPGIQRAEPTNAAEPPADVASGARGRAPGSTQPASSRSRLPLAAAGVAVLGAAAGVAFVRRRAT
jgi:hypothetical protein